MNALVTAFLLLMFAAFPLFVSLYINGQFPFIHFDDGFVGIRHQKYYFFVAIAAMALIAELLLLLTRISGEKGEKTEQKPLLKTLSFTDWSAIALALSCALSTLFSPYITLAFWGEMSLGSFSVGSAFLSVPEADRASVVLTNSVAPAGGGDARFYRVVKP